MRWRPKYERRSGKWSQKWLRPTRRACVGVWEHTAFAMWVGWELSWAALAPLSDVALPVTPTTPGEPALPPELNSHVDVLPNGYVTGVLLVVANTLGYDLVQACPPGAPSQMPARQNRCTHISDALCSHAPRNVYAWHRKRTRRRVCRGTQSGAKGSQIWRY